MAGVVAHHVYKPVYRYAQTATRYGTKKVKQLMGWHVIPLLFAVE
jgi:hypothetical protein